MAGIRNSAIIASAGTGKTYRLAMRYIKLLSKGVNPREIMALTFTKAAAAEMLDRILAELSKAVLDESGPQNLHDAAGLDEMPTRSDCGKWLDLLLKELPFARISTYDSFFNEILRSFALELGLDPTIEILSKSDENELAKLALADFWKGKSDRELYPIVSDLNERKEIRKPSEKILEKLEEIGDECLFVPQSALKGITYEDADISDLMAGGDLSLALHKFTLSHLALSPPIALEADDLKSFIDSLNHAIMDYDLKPFWDSAVMKKCERYGRSVFDLIDSNDLKRVLTYLGARELKAKMKETKATFLVSKEYQEKLLSRKFDKNAFSFQDVTITIAKLLAIPELVADIYFRLDASLKHILIDEFQDTSWQQWEIMRPLLDEIISDGERSLFVVGDLKQAIYSWRGSSSEIFLKFLAHYKNGFEVEQLVKSYRSVPAVLNFLNEFFSLDCFYKWREKIGYAPHVPSDATASGKGYANIRFILGKPNSDSHLIAEAVDIVKEISPHKRNIQCAILTRNNSQAEKVAALLKENSIPCASSTDISIIDYEETRIMLTFFKALSDPSDKAAVLSLRWSPLRSVFNGKKTVDVLSLWRRKVIQNGFKETVSQLVRQWDGFDNFEHRRRCAKNLSDIMYAASCFDENAGNDLEKFIEYLKNFKRPREKGDPGRIIVSTIHSAKGLTYDMVIFPMRDFPLGSVAKKDYLKGEKYSDDFIAPEVTAFIKRCNKIARFSSNSYKDLENENCGKQYVEDCNLLYVALTRAAKAVYVICADNKTEISRTQFRFYLKNWLLSTRGKAFYELGDENWYADYPLSECNPPSADEKIISPVLNTNANRRRQTVSPSKLGETEREEEISDEITFVTKEREEAMRRGSAIHACCESILWLGDAVSAPAAPPSEEAVEAKAVVDAYIARHPENVFVKPKEVCEVRREMPFMALIEDKLVKGIMDRVHFYPSAQAPERIVVYDFKTGHPHEENQVQIDLYVKVLRDIYGIEDISGELVYLEM